MKIELSNKRVENSKVTYIELTQKQTMVDVCILILKRAFWPTKGDLLREIHFELFFEIIS
jgi:hypothetical protein